MKKITKEKTKKTIRSNKPIKKRRRKKKSGILVRRICLVLGLASCLASLLLGVTIGITAFIDYMFKISKVEVKGSSVYTKEQVIELSGAYESRNLITYNCGEGIRKIDSSLPYAENIRIRKEIPNKIIISFDEAIPSYAAETPEGVNILVSQRGRNIGFTDKAPEGLTLIKGASIVSYDLCLQAEYKNKELIIQAMEAVEHFKSHGIDKIKWIDLSEPLSAILNYDGRINIILGPLEDIEYKALTAEEILKNKVGLKETGKLDLSECKNENRSYFVPEYIKN